MADKISLEKIQKVKALHENQWLKLPQVQAAGIGLLDNGQTGIIISVDKADDSLFDIIPAEIDGIPVEIIESGRFKAQ